MNTTATDPGLRHRLRRVARRVADQHHSINDYYGELSEKIASNNKSALRVEFDGYRSALAAHFELEEQIFFPAVCCVDETQSGRIKKLVAAHSQLLVELGHLSESLDTLPAEEFSRRMVGFSTILSSHEHQEEVLLTRATQFPPTGLDESEQESGRDSEHESKP